MKEKMSEKEGKDARKGRKTYQLRKEKMSENEGKDAKKRRKSC